MNSPKPTQSQSCPISPLEIPGTVVAQLGAAQKKETFAQVMSWNEGLALTRGNA